MNAASATIGYWKFKKHYLGLVKDKEIEDDVLKDVME